jgi:molybdate transport system ATP-binding protein
VLQAKLTGQVGSLSIDIELDTRAGSLVLVGPNGAGKTSVLLMLLGARKPRAGRIALSERVLFDSAANIDIALEARALGYVPQDYALFPHLSVRENVEFALGSHPLRLSRPQLRERAQAWLVELQLQGLADRRPATLSGGEKQRVALARALAVEPRALLLDEPLAALDIGSRREVRAFLVGYLVKLKLPTLVVTHDPADARALGQRIAVLEAGRIVQTGSWPELAAQPASAFIEEFARA